MGACRLATGADPRRCRNLAALPLGLGYLWMLFDRDGLTWHDRLSHTRLVLVEKLIRSVRSVQWTRLSRYIPITKNAAAGSNALTSGLIS